MEDPFAEALNRKLKGLGCLPSMPHSRSGLRPGLFKAGPAKALPYLPD